MRRPRSYAGRAVLAIEHWIPLGAREFAVLVLAAFAIIAVGTFAHW
jgi:hypothetical protein